MQMNTEPTDNKALNAPARDYKKIFTNNVTYLFDAETLDKILEAGK